jgi:hypothetical protein
MIGGFRGDRHAFRTRTIGAFTNSRGTRLLVMTMPRTANLTIVPFIRIGARLRATRREGGKTAQFTTRFEDRSVWRSGHFGDSIRRQPSARGGKPGSRLPARRSLSESQLIQKTLATQSLPAKARPRLRVICATPFQKRLKSLVLGRSFVACAESFGNCDGATEGGIPRSSRSRWFA